MTVVNTVSLALTINGDMYVQEGLWPISLNQLLLSFEGEEELGLG
jgi:hypothetical protein